jgi:hypothetical protein
MAEDEYMEGLLKGRWTTDKIDNEELKDFEDVKTFVSFSK